MHLLVQAAAVLANVCRPAAAIGAASGDPSWVHCWERGHSRAACCRPSRLVGTVSCFDSIYTRKECCGGAGWARLFPVAEPELPVWEGGAHWAQVGSEGSSVETDMPWLQAHPAFSREQRRWEAEIANASVLLSEKILGHRLRLYAFKRSGPALDAVFRELRDDLYRLQHVAASPPGSAPVVLDIGASIGVVAVLLGYLWSNARIVAVEPAPANFRYLLWNIRANGLASRIWPLNVAIGAAGASARTFYYSPTYPTWSQACGEDCRPDHADNSWRGGWTDWQVRFEVEVLTFAELIAALGLGDIHMLKVDCEGCEWDVFAPLPWSRIRHRVKHVAAELHRWALPDEPEPGLVAAVHQSICVNATQRENTVCSTM